MSHNKPMIRHLAIITLDPEKMAKFYCDTFQMERLKTPGASGSKAVYVTDGYITLALLENKAEGKPSGLNHFGFQVQDQEEIAELIDRNGGKRPVKRPADRAFAETRGTDPDGNNFDLSVKGYDEREIEAAKTKSARRPEARHQRACRTRAPTRAPRTRGLHDP